jgi:hypothetical protein
MPESDVGMNALFGEKAKSFLVPVELQTVLARHTRRLAGTPPARDT